MTILSAVHQELLEGRALRVRTFRHYSVKIVRRRTFDTVLFWRWAIMAVLLCLSKTPHALLILVLSLSFPWAPCSIFPHFSSASRPAISMPATSKPAGASSVYLEAGVTTTEASFPFSSSITPGRPFIKLLPFLPPSFDKAFRSIGTKCWKPSAIGSGIPRSTRYLFRGHFLYVFHWFKTFTILSNSLRSNTGSSAFDKILWPVGSRKRSSACSYIRNHQWYREFFFYAHGLLSLPLMGSTVSLRSKQCYPGGNPGWLMKLQSSQSTHVIYLLQFDIDCRGISKLARLY